MLLIQYTARIVFFNFNLHFILFILSGAKRIVVMTRFIPPLFFLAVLLGFFPLIAAAQISDGELVRVKTVDGSTVGGTVSDVTSRGLSLRFPTGDLTYIPFNEMTSLQRSIGNRGYGRTSVLVGTGAGFVTGVAVLAAWGGNGYLSTGGIILLAPISGGIFALGGALAGRLVGLFIERERWEEVSVPGMGSMSFEPRIGVRANGSPVLGVQMVF